MFLMVVDCLVFSMINFIVILVVLFIGREFYINRSIGMLF